MDETAFDSFRREHPPYDRAYAQLAAADPALALSAQTVFALQGRKLGPVAAAILEWIEASHEPGFISRYVERVRGLNELQRRFLAAPSPRTLGDPTAVVDREAYDLALLLSFIFSHHRFEILLELKAFLDFIRGPRGRIASVGMGTGYEIFLIAEKLKNWTIEGYDTDERCRHNAARLLAHFGVAAPIVLGGLFPLDTPADDLRGRYDAIVMCELLEHLESPLYALLAAREYLAPGGHLFITMAVNIAQEDHLFLYPDIASCRAQVAAAGLRVLHERIAPVRFHPQSQRTQGEAELTRGNYVAVVHPQGPDRRVPAAAV
jgi:SAM-dependent methyltransferase